MDRDDTTPAAGLTGRLSWLRGAGGLLAGLLVGAIVFQKHGAPKEKLEVHLQCLTNWAEYPVALFKVTHQGTGSITLYFNLTEQRTNTLWPPPTPYGFNYLNSLIHDGESTHETILLRGNTSTVVRVFQPSAQVPWRAVMLHVSGTREWPKNSTRQKLATYFNQRDKPSLGRWLNPPQPVEVIYGPELKPREKLPLK